MWIWAENGMDDRNRSFDWSKLQKTLPSEDLDRIIEMAWEDRTPFGSTSA